MSSRTFEFTLGKQKCWAQAHPGKYGAITLQVQPLDLVGVSIRLTPAEARAWAVALEAAAVHAENVVADTGLGEAAAA